MSGLVDVLINQEDRGVSAVILAFKETGILSYNYEKQYYKTHEMEISEEALRRTINKHLRR